MSSRDNWARLVEAVVLREKIRQMFLEHSRSPSISTIESSQDDHISVDELQSTNDGLRVLSVSQSPPPPPPPGSVTNPPVSKVAVSNTNATVPSSRKLFSGWYRRRKPENRTLVDIPEIHIGRGRKFSLEELRVATDNFSQKNVLPYGFHKVYKGRLADGSLVAVKRFKREHINIEAEQLFQIEVETINMAAHPNVIRLRGYCITTKKRLLVFPYMANGSVASCLRERPVLQPPLKWPTRKRIALGSAKGLAYLHDGCDLKIIHRDVNAANILLDEDFEAVIADFELAKLTGHKDTHITTVVRGTIGHIAPEYITTGVCTEKTDVFSYGIFLLELITGQRAFDVRVDNDDGLLLHDWVKKLLMEKKLERIVDANCVDYMEEEVQQLVQLALLCTQSTPKGRPKMFEIVRMLEGFEGLAEWEQR